MSTKVNEADAMTDSMYEAKGYPEPTEVTHDPDESVAVCNPINATWSIWFPGAPGWAVLPLHEGAQALYEVISAPQIGGFAIWRVAQTTGTAGDVRQIALPLCRGLKNQKPSSRVAIVLSRLGALDLCVATSACLIATAGEYPASEAPIFVNTTAVEAQCVPQSNFGQPITAPQITDAEVPPRGQAIRTASGNPSAFAGLGAMPSLGPLLKLGAYGAIAFFGYRWLQSHK